LSTVRKYYLQTVSDATERQSSNPHRDPDCSGALDIDPTARDVTVLEAAISAPSGSVSQRAGCSR